MYLPHERDVQLALSQVKDGKAAGSAQTFCLAEMLKVVQTNSDFIRSLINRMVCCAEDAHQVCKQDYVVQR